MARFIILEQETIDKLQTMICDEIEATENVMARYHAAGHSTVSMEWDIDKLKAAQYALTNSKKAK